MVLFRSLASLAERGKKKPEVWINNKKKLPGDCH